MVCFSVKISAIILTSLLFYYTVYPLLLKRFTPLDTWDPPRTIDNVYAIGIKKMGGQHSTGTGGNGGDGTTVFSVLSWNIWFGSKGGWDQPNKRWSHLLNIAVEKNPDVIGFQECTSAFLKTLVNTKAFTEQYTPANEPPKGYTYFVMVYVKKSLHFTNQHTILLKTNLGRRCESVDVKKNGMLFRFGTVHVESYVTSENVREVQMNTIFNTMTKKSSSIQIAFVVGDFNFDESGKENVVIDTSDFVDTWPLVHPSVKGYTFENQVNLMNKYNLRVGDGISGLTQERLDRILFSDRKPSGWKPVHCEILGVDYFDEIELPGGEKLQLFPSDHFGLFATFNKNEV